jgi:hypothetical protein
MNELINDPHQVPVGLFFPFFYYGGEGDHREPYYRRESGGRGGCMGAYALNILGQLGPILPSLLSRRADPQSGLR